MRAGNSKQDGKSTNCLLYHLQRRSSSQQLGWVSYLGRCSADIPCPAINIINNFFIVSVRYLNANIFSTWKIMSSAPKRLTGDKAAIGEFIDKFDVRYPVPPDVNRRDNLADAMT
jgi:hypothetical protein